jgi:succinyl-diaminopimelate desuccinylase
VREVVQIKSIRGIPEPEAPFGKGPAQALKKALEIAKDLGFSTSNLDGYIGYAEYGSGEDYIAILGHLDVVPEGEGWEHPPYAADISDGKIFGRGTIDNKGPIIAALFALKALRDSGLTLSKKVRVIFGTNEETANEDISYYLEREKNPLNGFTPDAFYPVVYAEKGIINLDIVKDLQKNTDVNTIFELKGGSAANIVPDQAEAVIAVQEVVDLQNSCTNFMNRTGYKLTVDRIGNKAIIKSFGIAAHGSTPEEGKNAIMQLTAFLESLPIGPSDISDAISSINEMVDMETDGKSLGLAFEDKPSGKLSLNIGIVNMTNEKISFTANLRYPVTFDFDDVMRPLNHAIIKYGFRIENLKSQKPLYYPPDSPLVMILLNVFKEWTQSDAPPRSIGGGTYAKMMPNIIAFGPIFPGEPMVEHKPDEHIRIDELVLNCKIFADAIYQLAR